MQTHGCRYLRRYYGHAHMMTDIKEAVFYGQNEQYVLAGSDDGCLYCWDTASGALERICQSDSSIVNCVQPHPFDASVAVSGIDNSIKLWDTLATATAGIRHWDTESTEQAAMPLVVWDRSSGYPSPALIERLQRNQASRDDELANMRFFFVELDPNLLMYRL